MIIKYEVEETHSPPTPITFCDADYSEVAEVGDTIKSYSFDPTNGLSDMFKIGTVTAKGYVCPTIPHLKFYSIVDDRDKVWHIRIALDRWLEYDNRIVKLEEEDV